MGCQLRIIGLSRLPRFQSKVSLTLDSWMRDRLVDHLHDLGVLDWDAAWPPYPENLKSELEILDHPGYLAFRSPDPTKVPGTKFYPELFAEFVPAECLVIAQALDAEVPWLASFFRDAAALGEGVRVVD